LHFHVLSLHFIRQSTYF